MISGDGGIPLSDAPKPCYLLFKSDGSGQFPMYRTTDGKAALMLFKSLGTARAFVKGKGMSREWQVEQYSQARFVDWVREAVKRHGASELAIDPDPTTSSTDAKVMPVITFLIELEGR